MAPPPPLVPLPTWGLFACMLYISIILILCLKWWQMHPKYGKNIGPPVLPIVGSFLSMARNQHRMYEWATELLRQSPSLTIRIVIFGLEIYSTANPANVEHMLKTNFHNYNKGFRFRSLMEDMLGNGIFNADGALWKAQRKAASYEFTSNSLKTMTLDLVQKEIGGRLLPVLYDHICRTPHSTSATLRCCGGACSAPIDLQDILLRFAFDNICQISLGIDPACLNRSLADDTFAKAFDDATENIIQRFFTPPWLWKLKRLLNLGSERKLKKALHIVHSFAEDVIRRRKEERTHAKDNGNIHQRSDLLFRLLRMSTQSQDNELASKVVLSEDDDDPNNDICRRDAMSDELVKDMVISFLLAGRDTSSIALSWFFWLLTQHPHVEAAIYEEITRIMRASRKNSSSACAGTVEFDRGTGEPKPHRRRNGSYETEAGDVLHANIMSSKNDGNVHDDDGGERVSGVPPPFEGFTYEELKEMKYLHAALQEAMRLYPPVPHDTKLVVEADVLPDGTRLSAGAQLAYHAYAMGRIESIWGDDCASFRPERWMMREKEGEEQATPSTIMPVSPCKWPVFQAGPRICLGKDMAMMQMKCVAAAIIQSFTLALPAGFHSPRYKLSFTLKMQHGLPVHLHLRQPLPISSKD